MNLAIMQPYIFPYLGYFQLINSVDTFVVYDDVNFIKKGWINRNNILVNNQARLFTIPLIKASQNKRINEIRIFDEENWREKFLNTIKTAYKKAPEFIEVYPLLEEIILFKEDRLDLFLINQLKLLANFIGIQTAIKSSTNLYDNNHLKAEDRIIDICKIEKCSKYINAKGGVDLYDKGRFADNGMQLNFLFPDNITYKQYNDEFVPYLSIIDILMFNSKEKVKSYLQNYKLN